jgi:hypothetical protein
MEKLMFIAGQLNVELQSQEIAKQNGYKKIISDPEITLGGRAYRQAIFSKDLGMNIILLACIGDDYYGKMIRESLEKAGISTRYIREVHNKNTGMSIKIGSPNSQIERYFNPGANLSDGEFKLPVDYYLHLCDAVIVNRWCNFSLRRRILHAAQINSIPNIYVHSDFLDGEEKSLPMDYLFLDFSEADSNRIVTLNVQDSLIKKGIFIYKKSAITILSPTGEEFVTINIPPEMNADFIVTRIMAKLNPQTKLNEIITFTKLLI